MEECGQLEGHYNWVRCIEAEDGILYSGSDDKTIKMWDIATRKCISTLPSKEGAVHSLLVHDGKLYAGNSSNELKLWHSQTNSS